ncbi:MAG: hypothetical protein HPY70_14910 [Firmicutes bacterium]|nr:hypothetical protein [Bacillota bacterium]
MSIKRTYSFPDEDSVIVSHIDNQMNSSAYIRELVRRDMEAGGIPEAVRRYIDCRMREIAGPNRGADNVISIDAGSIMDIFGIKE